MERLFIYVFIVLVLFSGILFWGFKRFFVEEDEERNFTAGEFPDDSGYVQPAAREVEAYADRQSSIIAAAVKKAPKTIMTTIFIQVFLMAFTGYLSVQNIERLAMAGSALSQGDYGMAVSALWPIGKEAGIEQWRVATGNDPYLDENDLTGFAYIGKLDGKKIAVMDHLFSFQDNDETITTEDENYNKLVLGLTAGTARKACRNSYPDHKSDLISRSEWELSRGHFLAARNVKAFPNTPEWARDISKDDSDDYYVIAKDTDVRKTAKKMDLDGEEDWLYIDENALPANGFRCSITW